MQCKQNVEELEKYDLPEWVKFVNELLDKQKKGDVSEVKNKK